MCGRFAWFKELIPIRLRPSTGGTNLFPSYNFSPGKKIQAIRMKPGKDLELPLFRWGLVNDWQRDLKKEVYILRSDTLAAGKFGSMLKTGRCIVPADGFYEWHVVGKRRQPYFIRLKEGQMAMAGLWQSWAGGDGEVIESACLITTEANPLLSVIHNDGQRMPAILPPDDWEEWLDAGAFDRERLVSMLKPYPAAGMEAWPVGQMVGKPGNDGPELIAPVPAIEEEKGLFD